MFNLKSYRRNLEEFKAVKRGQLLEFLAQERKRKLAADRRSERNKKLPAAKKPKDRLRSEP